nr:hypothetical protein pPsy0479a_00112 [Pseudomonas syringae]
MQLDGSLSLTERQSLAAKRTHELRHKATESKIRAACRQLQAQGKTLARSAIATLARRFCEHSGQVRTHPDGGDHACDCQCAQGQHCPSGSCKVNATRRDLSMPNRT